MVPAPVNIASVTKAEVSKAKASCALMVYWAPRVHRDDITTQDDASIRVETIGKARGVHACDGDQTNLDRAHVVCVNPFQNIKRRLSLPRALRQRLGWVVFGSEGIDASDKYSYGVYRISMSALTAPMEVVRSL